MTEPTPDRPGNPLVRRLLIAVAVSGVAASMVMVVLGLPESTPAQSVLLELAMAPTSISLAAALGILAQRARSAGQRSRALLMTAGVIGFAGIGSMVLAYLTGPRPVVHLGQALLLVGLLAALLVTLRLQPAPRPHWFELPAQPDEADDDEADPEV